MDSRPVIAVVGAGWAGLAAASRLAADGCRVVVLEKRGVPGGRAYSYRDPETGDLLDNGPHIFLGCYSATLRFLDRIGAGAGIRFSRSLRIAYVDRERGPFRFRCPGLPSPLHLLVGVLGVRGLGGLDRLRALRVGPAVRRSRRSGHSELEDTAVRDWLEGLGQNAAIRRAVWNPIAVAACNESTRITSAAVFARVIDEAFLSGRRQAVGLGAVGLSEIFAGPGLEYLERRGSEVMFRAAVRRIGLGPAGIDGLELADGARLAADAYIFTVPPAELVAALPAAARTGDPYFERIAGLATSPIISIHLWYERAFLDEPFVGLLGSRTQWLFDRYSLFGPAGRGSAAGSPPPAAGYSALISAARDFIDWSASDIIAMAEEDIAASFPAAAGARLLRARVVKERHATISPAVGSSRLRPAVRGPVPNLFLGGDWTATGLPGCIEGAVRSGERAAEAVLESLRRRGGRAD